jgi:hypothetical protein
MSQHFLTENLEIRFALWYWFLAWSDSLNLMNLPLLLGLPRKKFGKLRGLDLHQH